MQDAYLTATLMSSVVTYRVCVFSFFLIFYIVSCIIFWLYSLSSPKSSQDLANLPSHPTSCFFPLSLFPKEWTRERKEDKAVNYNDSSNNRKHTKNRDIHVVSDPEHGPVLECGHTRKDVSFTGCPEPSALQSSIFPSLPSSSSI